MNWNAVWKTLAHVGMGAAGAALGYTLPQVPVIVSLIPNPIVGAVVGSVVTSLVSAFSQPPNATPS